MKRAKQFERAKKSISVLAALTFALLQLACGGRNFRTTSSAQTPSAPPRVELHSEISAGTLHFPPGTYTLNAVDDAGFYYRVPSAVVQHSFSGSVKHDGGIFVTKRDRKKLRGYVIMPGGLIHVGNLSRADYSFGY